MAKKGMVKVFKVNDKDVLVSEFKDNAYKYLQNQVLDPNPDRMNVPWQVKLAFVQMTPKAFVKMRPVGKSNWKSVSAPYLPIRYVKRCLNFVSNFRRGYTITDKEMIETEKTKTSWWKYREYQAYIQMRCWIELNGREERIEQEVIGTRKQAQNYAVPKFEVYKSAESNGIKRFAENLGIWADKGEAYNEAVGQVRQSLMADDWSEQQEDDVIGAFTGEWEKTD